VREIDPTIRLWDAATGKPRSVLRSPDERFYGASWLCFSPDGKTLASAGAPFSNPLKPDLPRDNQVRLWDLATGKELRTFAGGKDPPDSVAVSPDGKALAVPADGGVRLWEVATGKEIRRLGGRHRPRWFQAVAFSPDGRLLADAGGRSVRLWEVAT